MRMVKKDAAQTVRALGALTGLNDPEGPHLGPPRTPLSMGPGVPLRLSRGPSGPAWAPWEMCLSLVSVALDCDLWAVILVWVCHVTMDLPGNSCVWPQLPSWDLTCGLLFWLDLGAASSPWSFLAVWTPAWSWLPSPGLPACLTVCVILSPYGKLWKKLNRTTWTGRGRGVSDQLVPGVAVVAGKDGLSWRENSQGWQGTCSMNYCLCDSILGFSFSAQLAFATFYSPFPSSCLVCRPQLPL